MSQETVILQTEHLTKHFGSIVAIDDLNLTVNRGEIFGFLGPNGSGKSTTIGMVVGLIAPTSGSIKVFGLDNKSHLTSILPRIGTMTEYPGFYPYLSGWDNLKIYARFGDISKSRIEEMLELVNLSSRAKDNFKNYSQGMKQRLAIACALLHNPELIIMDEPTNGLDPAGMKEIRELILDLGKQGKTIFLNSHLLHEVEQVCNHVAIIQKGKMIANGKVETLIKQRNIIQVKVSQPDRAVEILKQYQWIESVEKNDSYLLVGTQPDRIAEINTILVKSEIQVLEIKLQENNLESFFMEMTEGKENA
ncbi:MAG: ABC transporter ATP-binding protein [Chloroflexi bacterium]|nr:ABC transporter ATP-binding protein [Chloroflexota bacterium]